MTKIIRDAIVFGGWLLVFVVAVAIALLWPVPAHGATRSADIETIGAGKVRFTLSDKPCSRGLVLAMLQPVWKSQFQDGELYLHETRATVPMCWSGTVFPGYVFVIDENGNTGSVEADDFRPKPKGPSI